MVEVFKTNVLHKAKAEAVVKMLGENFPAYKVNFDLSDCDKILRIEADVLDADEIIRMLTSKGVICETLPEF
jgi:hypothetical protein